VNLNQVTIPSADLSIAVPFYQKLGLKLIVDALPRYARFECPDGDSTFSIHLANTLPAAEGIIVYFECEDLNATVNALQEQGIIFDVLPALQPWLWTEAHLRDPDNNRIILFHAGQNRKNPPWRIN
jgi:predicted enzyme related to lactoylglutathione lyase